MAAILPLPRTQKSFASFLQKRRTSLAFLQSAVAAMLIGMAMFRLIDALRSE
jgi:hypothetical protein